MLDNSHCQSNLSQHISTNSHPTNHKFTTQYWQTQNQHSNLFPKIGADTSKEVSDAYSDPSPTMQAHHVSPQSSGT